MKNNYTFNFYSSVTLNLISKLEDAENEIFFRKFFFDFNAFTAVIAPAAVSTPALSKLKLSDSTVSVINLTFSNKLFFEESYPQNFFRIRFRECVFHGWGRRRWIRYDSGASVLSDDFNGVRQLGVYAADPTELYSRVYQTILSAMGEALERKGFIRMHALSFAFNQQVHVLHFQSGLGKSSLAVLLLAKKIPVLSDEVVLVRRQNDQLQVVNFPLRVALTAKPSLELAEALSNRKQRTDSHSKKTYYEIQESESLESGALGVVFFGLPGGATMPDSLAAAGILERLNLAQLISFVFDLILGQGLPQILELSLRGTTLGFVPLMLFRRALFAISLVRQRRLRLFVASRSPKQNQDVLLAYLRDASENLKKFRKESCDAARKK